MFNVPATYATFDPSQQYSAEAEKEAKQAAKKAAKDAQKLANAGCGNYSCRICYSVVTRVAVAVSREIKPQTSDRDRALANLDASLTRLERMKQEQDVQEFMQARCNEAKSATMLQTLEQNEREFADLMKTIRR